MKRRRYGIDATPLLGQRTGIGRVVAELIPRIAARLDADEELVLCARVFRMNPLTGFSHAPLLAHADHPRVRIVRQLAPASVLRILERIHPSLSLDLRAGPLDVFHGTNYVLPVSARARGIVTIHDLSFLRQPEHVPRKFYESLRGYVQDAASRADRVIAVSELTRRDVIDLLGVAPERVLTIYSGVSEAFLAPFDREREAATLVQRYGVNTPYILFVGTTHPRKNVTRLLEAFVIARRTAALPHRLLLVGSAGFAAAEVQAQVAALSLSDTVHLPGFVPDTDLPALYRGADLLVYPSLIEGFGLPIVEAFATGTPVVTSAASCMPEVAGDAALLVDPLSVESIAEGMLRVLGDPELRQRLVSAGRDRLALFSWDAAADRHVALSRAQRAGAPAKRDRPGATPWYEPS